MPQILKYPRNISDHSNTSAIFTAPPWPLSIGGGQAVLRKTRVTQVQRKAARCTQDDKGKRGAASASTPARGSSCDQRKPLSSPTSKIARPSCPGPAGTRISRSLQPTGSALNSHREQSTHFVSLHLAAVRRNDWTERKPIPSVLQRRKRAWKLRGF